MTKLLNNKELDNLLDLAKYEQYGDRHNYFEELVIAAVQEIRENRKAVPSQMPLGEITQEILNKYYVYLETSGGYKIIQKIYPTGNEEHVFVDTTMDRHIRSKTTLALVSSVPK